VKQESNDVIVLCLPHASGIRHDTENYNYSEAIWSCWWRLVDID